MDEKLEPAVNAFAGRLGGNQTFIVDRSDPDNASLLERTPDAAPMIPLKELLDPRGFRNTTLWKQAMLEGLGSFILIYITAYTAISPNVPPPPFSPTIGPFASAGFIGGCAGIVISAVVLTVAILGFGPVTGGHLNPFITIATLFVRLTSLPRAVLYVSFQIIGASLAGLMVRASWDSRDFKVGGCFLFESEGVTVGGAFATEFTASVALIFIVFGVGFDPRNRETLGPTLGPFLIGCFVGVINLGFGFPKYGYGGPALYPTRCFGAYVGSHFPSYHWIHWVGPIAAAATHAIFYHILPPWTVLGQKPELKVDKNSGIMMPSRETPVTADMQTANFEKGTEERRHAQKLVV